MMTENTYWVSQNTGISKVPSCVHVKRTSVLIKTKCYKCLILNCLKTCIVILLNILNFH